MSEFKYACPVCGQHMMCDTTHGGSVMECPTCFQKIIAPQAPANADPKFILTGTQYVEKKNTVMREHPVRDKTPQPLKAIPVMALIILALVASASVYFFGGKLFHQQLNWATSDVGNVGPPGSFGQTNGTVVITGSGADIWSQADAFRYAYQALQGDVTLTVRVLDIQNTDPWAKAGVMIRESLDPRSAYAMALVTPVSGVALQQRSAPGSPASTVQNPARMTAPSWLRLTRQGNTFSAEASGDGKSWTPLGSTTIAMESQIYAGLAVCSHRRGTLCRATFDNLTVKRTPLSTGTKPPQ